jgi:hypothetical protein
MNFCHMVSPQPALGLILATLARIVSIAGTARKKAESAEFVDNPSKVGNKTPKLKDPNVKPTPLFPATIP